MRDREECGARKRIGDQVLVCNRDPHTRGDHGVSPAPGYLPPYVSWAYDDDGRTPILQTSERLRRLKAARRPRGKER